MLFWTRYHGKIIISWRNIQLIMPCMPSFQHWKIIIKSTKSSSLKAPWYYNAFFEVHCNGTSFSGHNTIVKSQETST